MLLKSFHVNPLVKTLVLSDFFMLAGIGFLGPILPVFISTEIAGGDVRIAGFATAVYMAMWVLQVPIGQFLDRHHGDKDDFIFLILGAYITALSFFLFVFAEQVWQVLLIQAIAGLGRAIDLPAWYALFTRSLDKKREGYEWSLENVSVALAIGLVGALSGLVTKAYGFDVLFLIAGSVSFLGATILLLLYPAVFKKGSDTAQYGKQRNSEDTA